MNTFINKINSIFTGGVIGFLCTLFKPVENDLKFIIIVFIANFLAGFIADQIVNNAGFKLKKAMACFSHFALFTIIICTLSILCELSRLSIESVNMVISTVTYAIFYFYGINILRNIKEVLQKDTPAYKVISFLYYVLTIEWVKRFSLISKYKEYENNNNNIIPDNRNVDKL